MCLSFKAWVAARLSCKAEISAQSLRIFVQWLGSADRWIAFGLYATQIAQRLTSAEMLRWICMANAFRRVCG